MPKTRLPQTWPDTLSAPPPTEVEDMLQTVWRILAELPTLYQRGETLLLHSRIQPLRKQIIAMMLAANGIRYPSNTQNLNLYLGDSQRAALEKTLILPPAPPQSDNPVMDMRNHAVAQALALVVIYQWYAPQLAQKYAITVPMQLEQDTLAHLAANIPIWPKQITTD